MATISEDERYTELLTHTGSDHWHWFVIGACYVIDNETGEDNRKTALGLIEAKAREVDWSELKWRTLLWQLGAEADFYERLERATSRPVAGGDSPSLRGDSPRLE